ncbi:MAG: hypothetical protein OJJ54_00020 [Pseudonocardia sp.]|nr:hypothetical protein [Pseudonocardia sp.]
MGEVEIRPEIALSWRRTESSGLEPGSVIDTDVVEIDPAGRLLRAARPVLDDLAQQLAGSRYAVILADRDARLVDVRHGVAALGPVLERCGAVPGRLFTESTSGTNSIATAFALRRGIAVHGPEHYLESFKRFACYGIPIRDPLSRRYAGVLDITCLSEDATPLLRPFLVRAVREIEAGLLGEARTSHRRVLAAFEAASVRTAGPLVAFGADLVLTNDSAADLLQPPDHAALQMLGRDGGSRCELDLASGVRVVASVRSVEGGFLVELERPDRAARPSRTTRRAPDSPDWHADLRPDLVRHRRERASVLVLGEPGTGRSAVAGELVTDPVASVAGAGATVDDVERVVAEIAENGTLLVEDAHLLDPAVAARAARLADDHALRLVLTIGPDNLPAGEVAAFAARCPVRLQLPPLRLHRDRIPALAAAMLAERTRSATRFTPAALRALAEAEWPGNLRELATVVGYVAERRSAGDVPETDLPPGCRAGARAPVSGALWQAERDAIVRALRTCAGNKVHAARVLGISRTTLYRRIRELRI